MNINQQQIQVTPAQFQLVVGAKGALAARLYLDFTQATEYDLDMQNIQATNQFDLCQTIWVDNSQGGSAVTVNIGTPGTAYQTIVIKSGQQGYYNVVCQNPIKMQFLCGGGSPVVVLLLNVAIQGNQWSAI